jgi:ubiquinone/menaquinone biosynthesis C-methylase UbiE
MKEFWNERYSQAAYAYGISPNKFYMKSFGELSLSGKILFPAEGEGRNAVYAARKGCEVWAYDISEKGKEKAMMLAEQFNAPVNYLVGTLDQHNFEKETFDAIVLIFAHLPLSLRSESHKSLFKLLKPGGYIILEAFNKQHIAFRKKNPEIGGPGELNMLLSTEEIKQDFRNISIVLLENTEVDLKEGIYHNGRGSVVRFIGIKK